MGNYLSNLINLTCYPKMDDIYYPTFFFNEEQINKHDDYTLIEIEDYNVDDVLEKIKIQCPKYYEISSKVLHSKYLLELNLNHVKNIHLINSFVDSIIHIKNHSTTKDSSMTIKITNESGEEIHGEIENRNKLKNHKLSLDDDKN